MGSTLEMVVVGVAVAGSLVWAGRAAWRSVRKQGVCSSCGSSGQCPVAGNPKALEELGREGKLKQPTNCKELAEVLEKDAHTEYSRTTTK